MNKIYLIRHSQASLGKQNYDELSPLGINQATLLGEYLKKNQINPSQIITGSLIRHKQTADCINQAFANQIPTSIDANWNEFDFKKLIQNYLSTRPEEIPSPGDVKGFFGVLKKSMLAWSEDKLTLDNDMESWQAFSGRVNTAIDNIQNEPEEPTFIVSSGGAISMLLMQILEVTPKIMIELNFQIKNSSFSEVLLKPTKRTLVAFNQINHLIETQNKEIITFA